MADNIINNSRDDFDTKDEEQEQQDEDNEQQQHKYFTLEEGLDAIGFGRFQVSFLSFHFFSSSLLFVFCYFT